MKFRVVYIEDPSINLLMFCKRYGSLEHTRFRLTKSTYIRHFWNDFRTHATFFKQVRYDLYSETCFLQFPYFLVFYQLFFIVLLTISLHNKFHCGIDGESLTHDPSVPI